MLNDKPSKAAVTFRLQWLTITPVIKTTILSILVLIDIAVLGVFTMATIKLLQERRSYINALEALGNPVPLITPGAGLIKPQTLVLQEQGVKTYSTALGNSHDFYALLHNPNDEWMAYIRFRFVSDGYEGRWQQGFVPPGEDMYLTSLGILLPKKLSRMNLDLEDLHFQRAKNYQKLKNIYLPLRSEDFTTTQETSSSPITNFYLHNLGPSSLANLPLVVVALQGGYVAHITTITLQPVPAFTRREVRIRWAAPLSPSISLRVLPLINVYDLNQFLEPQNSLQAF